MNRFATLVILAVLASSASAAGLDDLVNYREYSDTLSSSGQPTAEQLERVREAGFERVVYQAFTDHHTTQEQQDRQVKDLGMEYVNIPVDWEAPTVGDFALFAGALQGADPKKTLVHCQVNFRASSFSFLYRVLYQDVPMDVAKQDLDSVWVPDDTWREWIFAVLEANGTSPDCDACLWEERGSE